MATREEQIVYLTDWAARYEATLQVKGTVGFGRPCVGILMGDHYVDTDDVKGTEAYQPGTWWEPEDSYHKHDCLAVLDHGGNEPLTQLYDWVKWLDDHGYGCESVYRQPESQIDLVFHGISRPRLVKLAEQVSRNL